MLIERRSTSTAAPARLSMPIGPAASTLASGLVRRIARARLVSDPDFMEASERFLVLQARRAEPDCPDAVWDETDAAEQALLPLLCERVLAPDSPELAARARCLRAAEQGMDEGQISPAGQRLLRALLRDLTGAA